MSADLSEIPVQERSKVALGCLADVGSWPSDVSILNCIRRIRSQKPTWDHMAHVASAIYLALNFRLAINSARRSLPRSPEPSGLDLGLDYSTAGLNDASDVAANTLRLISFESRRALRSTSTREILPGFAVIVLGTAAVAMVPRITVFRF